MAVNTLVVLLGALSMAGVGIGAATISNMPHGGLHNGGCGASGYCPNGQAGGANGACGPANPVCTQGGNATCPNIANGTCPNVDPSGPSG